MILLTIILIIDVVALMECARVSLGICASGTGAIAGLLQWKVTPCHERDFNYYTIIPGPGSWWGMGRLFYPSCWKEGKPHIWTIYGPCLVHCSMLTMQIPGMLDGVQFRSMGARYIIVVEKGEQSHQLHTLCVTGTV